MAHNPDEGINFIKAAVNKRSEITEHYQQYKALSGIATTAVGVSHNDIKRAVDALYYLGGGWPNENSKGRMEALLDNVAGMYRVLEFIGKGELVENHLRQFGIVITLLPEKRLVDKVFTENDKKFLESEYSSEYFNLTDVTSTRELVSAIVEECQLLQRQICQKADDIKLDLRPAAQEALGVENAEYDRLHDFVKLHAKDEDQKAINKRARISTSISMYNQGLRAIKK